MTPIFRKTDGTLEESIITSLVDGSLGRAMVIRVPVSTSLQAAHELEEKLTLELGRPCLVVSRNIEFCKVEPVDGAEVVKLLASHMPKGPKVETTPSGLRITDTRSSAVDA